MTSAPPGLKRRPSSSLKTSVSHVDEGALPVASEGDAEAALTPVDFVAVEVTAEEAPEAFAPAREEPARRPAPASRGASAGDRSGRGVRAGGSARAP